MAFGITAADIIGSPITLIVGFLLIFYFFVLRPQKKKDDERRKMLDELKKGDRIVTIGGVHGEVVIAKEKSLIICIDNKKDINIKVARAAIASVVTGDDDAVDLEKA